MGANRIIIQVCLISALWLTIEGRPVDNDLDNEISGNVEPVPQASTTTSTTSTERGLETTTEYKHKEIVQAYTVKVPQVHSIRHAAGTYYFEVQPNEDLTEKLLEVQREVFDKPFSRTPPPKKAAPPKNK
ncbi:uncharacterized protein LOC131691461 [Topomyia yanbarensis]|uniref:uncharacterized protein LOC131691461 n=1 Tax=Topomyia yanbarensis TaxID=2498891 RepID=UPI00273BAE75|nr:uncharacterized protein LOC131691461 [Topomyia yanbarensis]